MVLPTLFVASGSWSYQTNNAAPFRRDTSSVAPAAEGTMVDSVQG